MPITKTKTDLRNKHNEISALCHKYQEPILITKHGIPDLVIMSIEAYEVLLGGVNTQSFSEAVKYCQRGDIVINASELKELKTNLVEELMKSHHMSKENATLAIKKFDVDAIAKKFPYHVRHYPIEMLVEGIFRAYQRD